MVNPLRILQVNSRDIAGGAEKIAWDLFNAYRARGLSSWLAVGEKVSSDPDVFSIPNYESRSGWYRLFHQASERIKNEHRSVLAGAVLGRLMGALADPVGRINYYSGFENFRFPGTTELLNLTPEKPDILHFHNLHGDYFDLRSLPWFSQQVPLLLTLHDAWLLSGHCAHSFACERWKSGCGNCPDLTIYPSIRRDATAINWNRKRKIYQQSRLYLATPSSWLMKKVEESILAPGIVEARVIPNGVDVNCFQPHHDRLAVRDALGIPQDAVILLTTGVQIKHNIWKDYPTLRDAVSIAGKKLESKKLIWILLGDDSPVDTISQVEIQSVPFVKSPAEVVRYYQAADIYVHAARADTFPTSILEAMACGVPVVATSVGGIPEQVEDEQSGFLVPAGDFQGIAARVVQMISNHLHWKSMSINAARIAKQKFSLERQIESYLNWYLEMIR